MPTAVIVDAVRTPMGRRNGKLRGWHPVDLAAEALKAVIERNDLDPGLVQDVIMGCVSQVGEQSGNIGRNAVISAGLPEAIPATTVDRACGSSQQAAHFAAQGVIAGAYDVVIAAGVESMSRVPMGTSLAAGGLPFTTAMGLRYADQGGMVMQGQSAEMIAERWRLSREELDELSFESHRRADRATREGRFEREVLPLPVKDDEGQPTAEHVVVDEGIRADTSLEQLAQLTPSFEPENGKITAGNSSQITDGASAVLITSEQKAKELGFTPMARFHSFALAGTDPIIMLTGPIPATKEALDRAGLTIDDLDHVEINEAFASVVLAWQRELHTDLEKVNPNGGAIALGHPLGCSGARLLTTMVHELERTEGRWGLQTMCEGGGMANATTIERLG